MENKDLFEKFVDNLNHLDLPQEKIAKINEYFTEVREKFLITEKLATVGQLGAGVAHEINNPLGIILMNIQVLAQKLKGGYLKQIDLINCQKNINRIEEAALRCRNIVENLLTFSGKFKLRFSLIQINNLIEEVIEETYELKDSFFSNEFEFIKEYGQNIPVFMGDACKLKQVFLNLVLNSLEAIKVENNKNNNWIKIATSAGNNQIKITVKDNGVGISEENLICLFDPFFSTKEQGTGLGLAVSYGIIEAHDGLIEVESTEGEGSTFTVAFPLAKNN